MPKKIKLNIFFAASPMHVMCIYEIYKKNPNKNFELIIFLQKNDDANDILFKTLDLFGFRKYKTFQMSENKLLNYFSFLLLAARFYKNYKDIKLTITMLDFRSSYMHLIRTIFKDATFILIDDGFYTFVAYQNYLRFNTYLEVNQYTKISGLIARLLYFGSDYNYLKKKKIELFSLYFNYFDTNKVSGSVNKFSAIKDKLGSSFPKMNHDNVFFIGTRFSERGAMSLKNELFFIEWLNNYWRKKGKTLFYIPKRGSEYKSSLIKKLKINVLKIYLPLELALIKNDFIPGTVCATGSTLLQTLPMIYKSLDYYLIDVTAFYFHKADKDIFDVASMFSSKNKIKTIVINRKNDP